MVIGFEIFLFAGVQRGTGDFLDLKPQQIELLRVGGFINHEIDLGLFNLGAALEQGGKGGARLLQSAKGVENGELARGVQQRLMIVWAVHIHQPFADLLEHGQRGGAAVDEFHLFNAATVDTITDAALGGSGDHLSFDISDLESLSFVTDLVDLDAGSHDGANGVAAAAMVAGDTATVSAAEDMDTMTNDEFFVITGNWASASALQTAIRTNLTSNADFEAGDAFLAVYDDGADSYVALISTADGVANDALFDDAVVTNIAKLDGITDSSTMATSDIVLAA